MTTTLQAPVTERSSPRQPPSVKVDLSFKKLSQPDLQLATTTAHSTHSNDGTMTMAKRKAVLDQAQGSIKRPRPAVSNDQTTDGTKHIFPLLELPAELRTPILQYIAQNYGTALINRRSRGELSTIDSIGLANKQLREEYVAVLYSCAPTVLVHVLDFDFRHIVTFFNKLRASEVRELPTKSALLGTQIKNVASSAKDNEKAEKILIDLTLEQRIFKAVLDFTPTCTSNPPFLLRWLGRLDAKSKTGHDTPFEYQARSRKVVLLWRRRAEWTSMWHLCPLSTRAREEIAKIEKALEGVAGKTESWKNYEYRYDEHPSDDDYVSNATESVDESDEENVETMGDFLRSLANISAHLCLRRPRALTTRDEAQDTSSPTSRKEVEAHKYSLDTWVLPYARNPNPVANSERPFRFLDLAAELRTEILSLVARHGGTALLKRNSGGIAASTDPLSLVNKQVREEYLGVLYQHALTTFAYVLDFHFRHVVTYFNKLNAVEVKALPTKATRPAKRPAPAVSVAQRRGTSRLLKLTTHAHVKTPDTTAPRPVLAPRTLKMLLDFTPMCKCESTHLLRWLKRFDAANKIGSKVRIDYSAVSMGAVSHWGNLETLTSRSSPDGPLGEAQAVEMKKIRDAASSAISQVRLYKASQVSPWS